MRGNKGVMTLAVFLFPILLASFLIYGYYFERSNAREAFRSSSHELRKLSEAISSGQDRPSDRFRSTNAGDSSTPVSLPSLSPTARPRTRQSEGVIEGDETEETRNGTVVDAINDRNAQASHPVEEKEADVEAEAEGEGQGTEKDKDLSATRSQQDDEGAAPSSTNTELVSPLPPTASPSSSLSSSAAVHTGTAAEKATTSFGEVDFSRAKPVPDGLSFGGLSLGKCGGAFSKVLTESTKFLFTLTSSKGVSDAISGAVSGALSKLTRRGRSPSPWMVMKEPANFVLGVDLQLAVDVETRKETLRKRESVFGDNLVEFSRNYPHQNYFEVSHMAVKAYTDIILEDLCPCFDTTLILVEEDLLKSAAERLAKKQRACEHKYILTDDLLRVANRYCTRLLTDAARRHPFDREDEQLAERERVDTFHLDENTGDDEMAVDLAELSPGATIVGPTVDMIAHIVDVMRRIEELDVAAKKAGCRTIRLRPDSLTKEEGMVRFLRAVLWPSRSEEEEVGFEEKRIASMATRAATTALEGYLKGETPESVVQVAAHYLRSCIEKGVGLPLGVVPEGMRTSFVQKAAV